MRNINKLQQKHMGSI